MSKDNENKSGPLMLVILDGFGIRKNREFNGVLNSNLKNYFGMYNECPHTHLHASGPLVGLPEGQIGSSEVGHMTIGAGRLIKQPIVRINEEIENEDFFKNKNLKKGLNYVSKSGGNVHLMGLLGPGGVHSKDIHLYAMLDFYDRNSEKISGQIFVHCFLDGRDTPQKSALMYLEELEEKIAGLENSNKFIISTLCGRYYAMDRDTRWERTKKAYDMLAFGIGKKFKSWTEAVEASYNDGVFDEFVIPSILHIKPIRDSDLVMFYNFRSDRPKQIVRAFVCPDFKEFERYNYRNLKFQTLTEYDKDFKVDVLYGTIYPKNTLGEILSKKGMRQLRISESEKFPHVTYFFNGLKHEKFSGEERIRIASPKVATYDLAPEMSAREVCERVKKEIGHKKHDFILLNFANSDMVGHTGDYDAVLKGMREVDVCLGEIKEELDKVGGTLMVTADHGNCETMRDGDGNPHTKHTYNLVPFILCNSNYILKENYDDLSLFNIAPTILELFGISNPKENAESLILKKK